jgi:hypothetical protein
MRYWVDMIEATAARIADLVARGTPANAIAVIAPVVEDVLQFELAERLRARQISLHTLRPSRPLIDQPLVRALLTLARLAHPEWGDPPTPQAVARTLASTIAGLDVLCAQRIVEASRQAAPASLAPIADSALWARIGDAFRARYEALCGWLATATHSDLSLDLFWARLQAEVLSQAGFALAEDAEAAAICDKLIASARAFRYAMQFAGLQPDRHADLAYIDALTHTTAGCRVCP